MLYCGCFLADYFISMSCVVVQFLAISFSLFVLLAFSSKCCLLS